MNDAKYPKSVALRMKVHAAGLRKLEATDQLFILAAREMIGPNYGDLNAAAKLRPLLSGKFPTGWTDLFTALLDMELALEKTIRAGQFAQVRPTSDDREEVGAWLTCHRDYWVMEMAAMTERLDILASKLIRFFLRSSDPSWRGKEQQAKRRIKALKDHIGPISNMIARGLTPGVTGISDAGLWEIFLATEPPARGLVPNMFDANLMDIDKWDECIQQDTANILLEVESISELLSGYVRD